MRKFWTLYWFLNFVLNYAFIYVNEIMVLDRSLVTFKFQVLFLVVFVLVYFLFMWIFKKSLLLHFNPIRVSSANTQGPALASWAAQAVHRHLTGSAILKNLARGRARREIEGIKIELIFAIYEVHLLTMCSAIGN